MPARTMSRPLLAVLTALLVGALLSSGCSLLPVTTSPDPAPSGGIAPPAKPAAVATSTVEPEDELDLAAVEAVDGKRLRKLAAAGAVIVDVREKDDFELERLPEAVNVPMSEFTEKAGKWAEDEAIVVYGSKDAKAKTAASWLVRNGYEKVYRLKGGIEDWDGEREGVLAKYRLDKPTVIYVYSPSCDVCAQTTPEFEKLKKKYGKKIDMEAVDARLLVYALYLLGSQAKTDEEKLAAAGAILMVTNDSPPVFYMVDPDPRVYRKVGGYDGLRVLWSWLQKH
ncbi:MAG: rhodanese-like domain-containing protein [Coriobacteriia bacterium]|nr:rhodanese-like domain-containing protein [Coriobacteriia bacterium]